MSGRTIKRAALIFLPLAVAAVVVSYLLYASQANAIRSTAQAAETRTVDLARQRIMLPVGSVVADASYLAEQDALRSYLARADADSLHHLEAEYLAFTKHRQFFDQLRFIAADGQEVARVSRDGTAVELVSADELQNEGDRSHIRETLKLDRGQVFISEIDLNVERGAIEQSIKPTIRIGAPVFDAAGAKRGIIVINYLARRILDRVDELRRSVPNVWMLNSEGYWI